MKFLEIASLVYFFVGVVGGISVLIMLACNNWIYHREEIVNNIKKSFKKHNILVLLISAVFQFAFVILWLIVIGFIWPLPLLMVLTLG